MQTTHFILLYYVSEVFPDASNGSVVLCILFAKKEGILLYLIMKAGFITKNLTCNLFTGYDFQGQR